MSIPNTITYTVDFTNPQANANVPGGGGFFAYGTVTPSGTITTCTATVVNASDGSAIAGATAQGIPGHPAPCAWGALVENAYTGKGVQLKITVQDAAGNQGSGSITFKPLSTYARPRPHPIVWGFLAGAAVVGIIALVLWKFLLSTPAP